MTPEQAFDAFNCYARRFGVADHGKGLLDQLALPNSYALADGTLYSHRTLIQSSTRADFTGAMYVLPRGARVVSRIAREPDAPIPDFTNFHTVYAYRDDLDLSQALRRQGRTVAAITFSPRGEVIACWQAGQPSRVYTNVDQATCTKISVDLPTDLLDQAAAEAGAAAAVTSAQMLAELDGQGLEALHKIVAGVDLWGEPARVRLIRDKPARQKVGRRCDPGRRDGTGEAQIMRFHLPIVTDTGVQIRTWDTTGTARQTHMKAGSLYYVDSRKPYTIVNPDQVGWIRLVVEAWSTKRIRESITAAYLRAER